MPRPMERPGKPNDKRLNVPVNAELLAYVDRVRGQESRARWIRELIRSHAAHWRGGS